MTVSAVSCSCRPIRKTAELTISADHAVALFAELSLALAGFADVASDIAGRERPFRALEHGRLLATPGLSAAAFAGSLAFVSASNGAGSVVRATRAAAIFSLTVRLAFFVGVIRQELRPMNDEDSTAASGSSTRRSGFCVSRPSSPSRLGSCLKLI